MAALIDNWESLRPPLEARADSGDRLALSSVRIGPPLPRPGKILCCIGNYWEHAQREARQLNMFLKNPDAVVGDGDVISSAGVHRAVDVSCTKRSWPSCFVPVEDDQV